jgi:membrane protease YdiL (CAAX protease family)
VDTPERFGPTPPDRSGDAAARTSRTASHPLVRLLVGLASLALVFAASQAPFRPLVVRGGVWGIVGRIGAMVVGVVATAATYALVVHLLERRRASELSLKGAGTELALGVALGASLFTAVVGALWLLGYYHVTGVGGWSAAAGALAGCVISGAVEEIMFRGVVFRNLEDLVGTWASLAISAALFGLLHIANPHASIWAAVAIAVEAGFLLGAGFVLTRRLWLVMGIHIAWNFTQGGVFGVTVSGWRASGLITSTLTGPPFLSGGPFGAEASVFAVTICLAAGVFLAWRAHTLGHFVRAR